MRKKEKEKKKEKEIGVKPIIINTCAIQEGKGCRDESNDGAE